MIHSIFNVVRGFLSGDGALILPEIELLLFACGILLIDRWLAENEKYWNAILALGGTAFTGFTLFIQYKKISALAAADPQSPGLLGFHQGMLVDWFFLFFATIFLAVTVLIILFSLAPAAAGGQTRGRFYALLLFGCAGMMLIASGVNVLPVFSGIEVAMLSGFLIMRGEHSREAERAFAALWACSSVALALGFLVLYGLFQTANLGRTGAILNVRIENGVAFGGLASWQGWLALGLLAAGIFLLIEATPLHWFAPQIYESTAAPALTYVSTASKSAGFALLLRSFSFLFLFAYNKWIHVFGGVAIFSLLWGTVAALRTKNVKRLLAYGSIAQTGFLLLGLVAGNENGFSGITYYVAAYVFSLAGVLGIFTIAEHYGIPLATLENLNGLYRRSRPAAILLAIFLASLAGIPGTAGFLARFFIVRGLFEASHPELGVFAALAAVVAVCYYGRIAVHAFTQPAPRGVVTETPPALGISSAQAVALTVAAFVSLAAGLYPEPFLRLARLAYGQ